MHAPLQSSCSAALVPMYYPGITVSLNTEKDDYDLYLLDKMTQCAISANFQTLMESGDFDIVSSMPMTSTVTIKFDDSKLKNSSTKTIIQNCDNYN